MQTFLFSSDCQIDFSGASLSTHWTRRNEKKRSSFCLKSVAITQCDVIRQGALLANQLRYGTHSHFLAVMLYFWQKTQESLPWWLYRAVKRPKSQQTQTSWIAFHASQAPESAGPSHGFKCGAVLCSTCCSSTKSDSAWIKHKGSVKYMPTSGWQQNGRWHPPH